MISLNSDILKPAEKENEKQKNLRAAEKCDCSRRNHCEK
jgi:hypothetical protein